ncbi:hypothetical protein BJI47_01455 [Rhodococcus sp. 1168]|nr:hypothetical protein BJI47_01455 [Rhodococcus sp. 1168]
MNTTTESRTEARELGLGLTAVLHLRPPACKFCAVRGPKLSKLRLNDDSTIGPICEKCATDVQRIADHYFPALNQRTSPDTRGQHENT